MKRCLVADQSAVIRKVARHFLMEARWHIEEAETAAEARSAYSATSPDLLILDWQIPGFDAVELIKDFRRLDGTNRPRILYLTSVEDRRDIWRALRSGADGYMLKPFDRASFTQTLREILPDEIALPEAPVALRA